MMDKRVAASTDRARGRKRVRDAAEAEREALGRLRAVVETAVDGIVTIDERGTIETVNRAAERLFGYEAAALVGRNVRMLMPEPYRSEHDQYIANFLHTGERKIIGIGREVEGLRADGSVFPMELAVSETRLDDRTIFTGIIRDISGRREADQALRESEARFRLMANSAPVLIWMSGIDRNCTWFNNRWLEFTGRSLEQELGDGWTEGVHPEDLDECVRTYTVAFDAREPFEMEFRLRRFDGEYRWLRNSGVPIQREDGAFAGYIGSCTDVTDRKLGEQALLQRVAYHTQELSAANEQLQHQIEERRRVESLLAAENRLLELIATGVVPERLLEGLCRSTERLIPNVQCAIRLATGKLAVREPGPSGESEAAVTVGLDAFGAIARQGVYPPVCEQRVVVPRVGPHLEGLRENGVQSYWLEPIVVAGGAIVGTLGVYSSEVGEPDEDAMSAGAMATRMAAIVLERASAEERAREQLAQLAHVARLATMGEMASGLAHELNQPLCAIVNYAEACVELVNREGPDRGQLAEALGAVARQAQRAGEVIRRLREFIKRGEPERQAVDINEVVRDVLALTNVESRQSDVRVSLELAERLPKIFADAIQIEQILVNLVRNACEAMRDGRVLARTLSIETARRKGAVEVRVHDSGPGMSEEVRQRLFEPFFSTKRDGMGLGLSISRSILEVHEGRIWATPNARGGTTFHFTLPTAWRARHGRSHRIRRR